MSDAPRVLHLRSSCGFYGAEGVIYNLVRHYAGPSLTVCLEDARDPHTELTDRLAAEGHATATVGARGAFDPAVPFRFAALLRRFRPDVVHAHDYKSDAVAYATTRWLPLLAMPLPLVGTMHGVVRITGALRRYERLDARVLRRFDAVVPVSAGTADIAQSYGVPPARIHRISNGVDTGRFRPASNRAAARAALGIPPDGFLAGVVGRLSAEKGHAVLLDAMAIVGRGARLAIVGDGPEDAALQARAAALGLSAQTHFMGRRTDMDTVYAALDAMALPSFSEGLPLTVLEAAACGVPVVASDVGDIGRVAPHEAAALLVPPGDAGALAGALVRLMDHAGLAARLAEAARLRVEGHYSARAMAAAYEGVYRQVAGRAPARALEAAR